MREGVRANNRRVKVMLLEEQRNSIVRKVQALRYGIFSISYATVYKAFLSATSSKMCGECDVHW